jgi:L-alanine-DL-glutamate epimerase-like enolase superfamily enzyme
MMKIKTIEVFYCDLRAKGNEFNPILIRVNTDEGISGVGEFGLAYGAGGKASFGMLKDLFAHVVGVDPMRTEYIWEKLFRNTFWGMGGGPVVYGAISAIDIACWDIRGKVMNAPIHVLLGGKTNDNLRTYASQIQFGWSPNFYHYVKPEDYAAAASQAVSEGYDCVKVDPMMILPSGQNVQQVAELSNYYGLLTHDQIKMGIDRLYAIRDAVGPKVDIIIEIHSFLGTNAAIQFARAVEDINAFYYEEPVHPMNTDNMALVARSQNFPVATGERSYTRWGYREFFEKHALAVIQPDLCLCGGITEGKKICDYANTYDTTVQIHACGGPVTTAAALQIEATIPNFLIHEHHVQALSPSVRELCVYDYQPVSGKYAVPDLPGLGQELNDRVLKDYDYEIIS